MGLLDYYRQFEGIPEEEVNRELREEAAERRRKALARVTTLDLSQTTWPDLPHANIVNAITFTARAGMQRYPHLRGSRLRSELAERHDIPAGRLIVGNGAAQLLSAATRALMEPGQELLTSWPSYPLFPIMARRAHGRAVPVGGRRGAAGGRAAGGRHRAQHARGGARQPQRPDRGAARRGGAGAPAEGAARGDRGAAGRGARRLRRRPADRRVAEAAGGTSAAAGVPQLLQGLGVGGCAWATRWGTGLGGAARGVGARPRRQRTLAGGRAGGAALRRQTTHAPRAERLRGAPAVDRTSCASAASR